MTSSDIFEGINSIAQLGMAITVAMGVWVAFRQLEAWRSERRSAHKAEVAEELLGLSLSAQDSFADVRNPFQSIPIEKAHDKLVSYEQRYEKVAKYNELFQNLRKSQIRVKSAIGDLEVDNAVSDLFKIRHEVAFAIEEMADYIRDDYSGPGNRERKKELRKVISSSGSPNITSERIENSIQILEQRLAPIVRFEAK